MTLERERAERVAQLKAQIAAAERELSTLNAQAELSDRISELGDFRVLPERASLLSTVEEVAQVGSWIWDTRTNAVSWSERLFRILGLDPLRISPSQELYFEAFHPNDRAKLQEAAARVAREGKGETVEARAVRPNGDVRELVTESRCLSDEAGALTRVVGVAIDVTDRRRSQRDLWLMSQLLEDSQEVAKLGSWRWTPANSTLIWSKQLYKMLEVDEAVAPSPALLASRVHPDDRAKFDLQRALALQGDLSPVEFCVLLPSGQEKQCVIQARAEVQDGKPVGMVGIIWDVTEQRQAQEHLHKRHRMDALSTLAGGIAHEINNPIQGIMNYAHLIGTTSQDADVKEYSEEIVKETERVANIIKAILEFARLDTGLPSIVHPEHVINNVVSLTSNLLSRENILLEKNLDSRLPTVYFQFQQLQQVLVNLISNSRNALVQRYPNYHPNKRIVLSSRQTLRAGTTWVELDICDQGGGIPEPLQAKIFDPFFTVDRAGRGTGLGLAISQRIVTNHGGQLRVQSDGETFTRMILELPASPEADRPDRRPLD